jgi:hypothetical protein
MTKKFQTVSSLQIHLKNNIQEAIQVRLTEIIIKVVDSFLHKNVYDKYTPSEDSMYSYDRTYELLNSITVSEPKMGHKQATFEVYMDTDKIEPNETVGDTWNQHADIKYTEDTSEYIPMWVEYGTQGSLWDRDPALYMYDSWVELSGGDNSLARHLAKALEAEGWNVIKVS